jgi:hypothetical protein
MSSSFETEVRHALHDPTDALNSAMSEFRPGQIRSSIRGAITSTLVPPAAATPSPPAPSGTGLDGSDVSTAPDDPSLN